MNYFKILIILFAIFFTITNVLAEDIDVSIIDIDTTNSNMLKIYLDKDIETNSTEVTSDIKLFKDLDIKNIVKDLANDKLVSINLNSDLEKNTSYSLLWINPADWNIDFTIEDLINWLEITWTSSDWIDKVNIINSRELNIYFKKSLETDNVEIKLLWESKIESISFNSDNKKELDIYLNDKLNNNSKFIIMIFTFTNAEEINYNVSNSIYSFETEIVSDIKVKEPIIEDINEENETDNVALNSATTPETWAETWILIFFTFIISSVIYFRRKI